MQVPRRNLRTPSTSERGSLVALPALQVSLFAIAALSASLLGLTLQAAEPVSPSSSYMQERAPTYHAFVFGNDEYTDIAAIKSAGRDFEDMRDYFRNAHYQIWDLDGKGRFASVDEFYKYMALARDAIKPGDVVVFYYSGHGFHYGNQDWLVPLGYPAEIVDQQLLFKYAVGLNDVIAGLAEKRIDYAIAIIDACRADNVFSFKKQAGGAVTGEPQVPGFNYTGPSLIAWNVGVPVYAGGAAIGLDSSDEPSLYTKILLEALKKRPRISDLRAELDVAVHHLTLEGAIANGQVSPRFLNSTDFSFVIKPDVAQVEKQGHEWLVTMAEPSRLRVGDYLIRNPGSSFSSAAWEYIDDHASDPEDTSGSTLTSADAIDASFPEGARTGKLIAVATSGFNVNFPRNTIGLPDVRPELKLNATVYADHPGQISEAYAAKYEAKGSKLKFDIDLLGSAGALSVNTGQISRNVPTPTARPRFTFNKSTSIQINNTYFDDASGKLFAEISPNVEGAAPEQSKTWADFDYRGDEQPSFNVLSRALREVVIDETDLSNGSISKITDEVRRSSREILWVSIAVGYRSRDLGAFEDRETKERSEAEIANMQRELNGAIEQDRLAVASARLTAQDARFQLINAGINGKRITTVSVVPGEFVEGAVRLRFFGSR
ncbi:caspase family protein (plasmid) [Rhizobium johnstonii]|nr:caspase family protein [Rhizobium johnstonii]